MICAYPVGWAVGNDSFKNGNVKIAKNKDETGPVVCSWNTVGVNNKVSSADYFPYKKSTDG